MTELFLSPSPFIICPDIQHSTTVKAEISKRTRRGIWNVQWHIASVDPDVERGKSFHSEHCSDTRWIFAERLQWCRVKQHWNVLCQRKQCSEVWHNVWCMWYVAVGYSLPKPKTCEWKAWTSLVFWMDIVSHEKDTRNVF